MPPLNAELIGEMAEAAGKCRTSCIDVLMGPLLSITPRGAVMVSGWVPGCHWPGTPLVSLCQNLKGSIDRPAGAIHSGVSLTTLCYL